MKATNQTQSVQITTEISKAITAGVKSTESSSKAILKVADLLKAAGVTAEMLSGKTKVAEVAEPVRAAIVLGFSERERKLIAGDAKAMTEAQKAERKTAQQKIGAYIALIQKYLREEKEKGETKSVAERLKIMLESCEKLVQGDEDPKGYDPVIMAKLIGQAVAIIK
jgi:DNA invertase Pin-like site-specific DNA recombinase